MPSLLDAYNSLADPPEHRPRRQDVDANIRNAIAEVDDGQAHTASIQAVPVYTLKISKFTKLLLHLSSKLFLPFET